MKTARPTIAIFVLLTLLTGVVYPLSVTGIAQLTMPHQANGSVVEGGRQWLRGAVGTGSEWIGQPFSGAQYFWSRPSATSPAYNGAASAGSNLGPTNPVQLETVRGRVEAIKQVHGIPPTPIPIDLVTASASGLDPHITPAAAVYQVARIAQVRGLSEDIIHRLINEHTEGRTLGILGEPRVNVLRLNLALDRLK